MPEPQQLSGGGPDTPEKQPPKRQARPHHPRPVKVVSIYPDGEGKLAPVPRVHPKCIFKRYPANKPPCGWYIKASGRCGKRLARGQAFQLNEEGMCPGWKFRRARRDIKAPAPEEGVVA